MAFSKISTSLSDSHRRPQLASAKKLGIGGGARGTGEGGRGRGGWGGRGRCRRRGDRRRSTFHPRGAPPTRPTPTLTPTSRRRRRGEGIPFPPRHRRGTHTEGAPAPPGPDNGIGPAGLHGPAARGRCRRLPGSGGPPIGHLGGADRGPGRPCGRERRRQIRVLAGSSSSPRGMS